MTWIVWLKEGRVESHRPARAEVAAQLRAADRSLSDAALAGISPEGRFQLAYGAALDLATVVVLASGYRVRSRLGHHLLTFEAAGYALGESSEAAMNYFDACRRRRNAISYEGSEVGEDLANELLKETSSFRTMVAEWVRKEHPELI